MTLAAERVHRCFLHALGDSVLAHTDIRKKPLLVDVRLHDFVRLTVFLFSLVGDRGTKRAHEYKAVLRVSGQPVGAYGSLEHLPGRQTVLAAYHFELDVFVLWDPSLHPKFKNGGNIQVRYGTVQEALVHGRSEQLRRLVAVASSERVLCCQSSLLAKVLKERITLRKMPL